MNAFKTWYVAEELRGPPGRCITLENAFDAGRQSILGLHSEGNIGIIFAKLSSEAREAKIRLAGVLWYLHEQEIISRSKVLELSDMTTDELESNLNDLMKDRST